jgi:GNAT superfamily N-acetyltransferase
MRNSMEKFTNLSNNPEATGERPLPEVRFIQGRSSIIEGKKYQEIEVSDEHGAVIGELTLETQSDSAAACIADIKLADAYVGKGFGRATYLELIANLSSKGLKLISGSEVSRQAVPVWEWLVEKGIARKVSEGHRDETKQNISYSTEKYEVL